MLGISDIDEISDIDVTSDEREATAMSAEVENVIMTTTLVAIVATIAKTKSTLLNHENL